MISVFLPIYISGSFIVMFYLKIMFNGPKFLSRLSAFIAQCWGKFIWILIETSWWSRGVVDHKVGLMQIDLSRVICLDNRGNRRRARVWEQKLGDGPPCHHFKAGSLQGRLHLDKENSIRIILWTKESQRTSWEKNGSLVVLTNTC